MRTVALFSTLLVIGIAISQILPATTGDCYQTVSTAIRFLTMIGLAFIMIDVGREFELEKSNAAQHMRDYFIAMTAAALPWLMVSLYYLLLMLPPELWGSPTAWMESLLADRFSAPTSAGLLFPMLAAAGLDGSCLYRNAGILAIFTDLNAVLLMIPLKILMVGLAWELALLVSVMFGLAGDICTVGQFLRRGRGCSVTRWLSPG